MASSRESFWDSNVVGKVKRETQEAYVGQTGFPLKIGKRRIGRRQTQNHHMNNALLHHRSSLATRRPPQVNNNNNNNNNGRPEGLAAVFSLLASYLSLIARRRAPRTVTVKKTPC